MRGIFQLNLDKLPGINHLFFFFACAALPDIDRLL